MSHTRPAWRSTSPKRSVPTVRLARCTTSPRACGLTNGHGDGNTNGTIGAADTPGTETKFTVVTLAQGGRGQAPALLVRHKERIVRILPDDLSGVRDLSLITMHFAIAGREHEVGWLRTRRITEDPEGRGLIVDVLTSKNYPRVVQVPYGSRAHLCPVRTWRRWRDEAGLDAAPDGFAYRRLHSRHHTVMDQGLDAEAVGDVITRLGERAQLDIRPTGHSPRRGLVTESSRASNPDAVAEKQGGWAKGSKVMRRYREDDDGLTENALHGVL